MFAKSHFLTSLYSYQVLLVIVICCLLLQVTAEANNTLTFILESMYHDAETVGMFEYILAVFGHPYRLVKKLAELDRKRSKVTDVKEEEKEEDKYHKLCKGSKAVRVSVNNN